MKKLILALFAFFLLFDFWACKKTDSSTSHKADSHLFTGYYILSDSIADTSDYYPYTGHGRSEHLINDTVCITIDSIADTLMFRSCPFYHYDKDRSKPYFNQYYSTIPWSDPTFITVTNDSIYVDMTFHVFHSYQGVAALIGHRMH